MSKKIDTFIFNYFLIIVGLSLFVNSIIIALWYGFSYLTHKDLPNNYLGLCVTLFVSAIIATAIWLIVKNKIDKKYDVKKDDCCEEVRG